MHVTKMRPEISTIFMWYKCDVRSKYRGSLFVTVKPTVCPSNISSALRSMYPSQAEKRASLISQKTTNFKEELETLDKLENLVVWAKLTGEICKIPNKKVENLYPGKNGCFSIDFSKNGRFIACGGMESTQRHVIHIFSVPDYQYIGTCYGHIDIIYCLSFDYVSSRLISCSSDNTARLWDVELFACLRIFPHSGFVYTVLTLDDTTFLSGCYDGLIRLYNYSESKTTPEKELVGHEAGVNCFCLSPDRRTLFSGDLRGRIITWIKESGDHNWQFNRKLSINEVSEKSIDTLMLNLDGRRLFVYCRDKIIYVVDTRSWTVRRRLASKSTVVPNRREFLAISRCCMTPCGTFIFAPAPNGCTLNVWRTRDMELMAEYKDLCMTSGNVEDDVVRSYIAVAVYHPLDHIVAFGVYGEDQHVSIYHFDATEKPISRISSFTKNLELNDKDSKRPDFSLDILLARQKDQAMLS